MESAKKSLTTDPNIILENIVNSPEYGDTFIPETRGRELILKQLPIEEANAAGKDSAEYKKVISVYNAVLNNLIARQNGIIQAITLSEPKERPIASTFNERRETLYKKSTGPYRGVYGNYSMKR